LALLAVAAHAAGERGAEAYSVESSASDGCHERFAREALSTAGYAAVPPPLSGDDFDLYNAVDFDTSQVDDNVYALSLALGVRSNDVGDNSPLAIGQSIALHNDPGGQAAHCLRSAADDFEEGDASAAAACRAFVEEEIGAALDAADAEGLPAPQLREEVAVSLLYQGSREVPVSTFYYHAGRALHALQDSFAHCWRTPDRAAIAEVANWVEYVAGKIDEERDGPRHDSAADECACSRPWGEPTYEAAVTASAELLAAISRPAPRAAREEAAREVIAAWLSHAPGCTRDNGFCASPDLADLAENGCGGWGCSMAAPGTGGAPGPAATAVLGALLAIVLTARRGKKR